MKTITERYEEFVDSQLEEYFSDHENTAGIFKAAKKAELMLKLDDFMLTFIEEIDQSKE